MTTRVDIIIGVLFLSLLAANHACRSGAPRPFYSRNGAAPKRTSSTGGRSADIRVYGAKGDGRANDTIALRSAIKAACNGSSPGTVLVPQRYTFLLSSSVAVAPECRLTGGGTIEWTRGCNCPLVINAKGDEIDHITFDGLNDVGPGVYAGTGAVNFGIDHNLFENFPNGSMVIAPTGKGPPPTHGMIALNYAHGNEAIRGHTPPIFNFQCGDGASNIVFLGNIFVGDGDFDIGDDGCSDVTISRNKLLPGPDGYGGSIQIEATSDNVSRVYIAGNIIHDSKFANGYPAQGINLATNGTGRLDKSAHVLSNFVVSGNEIYNEPAQGVNVMYVNKPTHTPGVIAGNVVYGNRDGGIQVQTGNVSVIGNDVHDNKAFEVRIACMSPCTAADNYGISSRTGLLRAGGN